MPLPLPDDAPGPPPADAVEALAAQFLARLQAGENPDREAVVRAHPHLGARLERQLAHAEMIYRVGLAPGEGRARAAESTDATTVMPGSDPIPLATLAAAEKRGTPGRRPANLPNYDLLAELGRGGMGVVYQALQKNLNRLVALKMISAGAGAGPDLLARFHVEAEALASLQHPHIVQVYEVGEHDGCPFLVMEYLDGGTLADRLAGRPQPPRAAAALVETLARAMHAAHQRGIVHRDLKPGNILLQGSGIREQGSGTGDRGSAVGRLIPDPGSLIPKITDFGLAKRLAEDQGGTATGSILGTPCYMAPEQAAGRVRDIGPATDVYALGAILYEMLTGRPPFRGETALATLRRVESEEPTAPSRLCPRLPGDLETICLKCLQKEPPRRYATALDLADDLRRFQGGEPITARPVGRLERAGKWVKRRPAPAALLGVSVAAALALAAGGVSWSVQVRAERDRARHGFQVARRAIDDLYTKMASERLFDEPQMDPLCQELLTRARDLYEELAREYGTDPDVRRDVALAWYRLGEIHRLRDQHGAAERAYREAVARQEGLRHDHPREPRYRQDLADSHTGLGELLRESGRSLDEAERHYRAARELQQGLVREFGGEPAYRTELARSHYNLGLVQRNTNRLAGARADYDQAVGLLAGLHRANRAEPNVRQDLARALINRGSLHRLGGRLEAAGRDFDRAVGLLAGLRDEFPARAAYKFELAIARQDRGNLFWDQARRADARHERRQALARDAAAQEEHRQALSLLEGLVADFTGRPRYRKKMGNALKNLGASLASAGDPAGAVRCWNQALTLFEALVKDYPETADYHGLLGMTLGNLGELRARQEKWPEARRLIERGVGEVRAALKPNPKHPDYRRELRDQYRDLAWALVHLGDHAAAAWAATAMADVFPAEAQYRYFAACFLARCVPLAKDDRLARRYAGRAAELLGEAAARAPPGLERIADEEQVFRPLAAHPEFGAALRQLDAKVRPKELP